jgi:hypothetical protein
MRICRNIHGKRRGDLAAPEAEDCALVWLPDVATTDWQQLHTACGYETRDAGPSGIPMESVDLLGRRLLPAQQEEAMKAGGPAATEPKKLDSDPHKALQMGIFRPGAER